MYRDEVAQQLIRRAAERLLKGSGLLRPQTLTSGGTMPRHRNRSIPCIEPGTPCSTREAVEAVENLVPSSSAWPLLGVLTPWATGRPP